MGHGVGMNAARPPRKRWIGGLQRHVFAIMFAAMAMLFVVGVSGAKQYHALLQQQRDVYDDAKADRVRLGDVERALRIQADAWRNILLTGPDARLHPDRLHTSGQEAVRTIDVLHGYFHARPGHFGPDLIEAIDALRTEQKALALRYRDALKNLRAPGADRRAIARDSLGRIDRATGPILSRIADTLDLHAKRQAEAVIRKIAATEKSLLAFGLATAILSCLLLLWRLERILARPLANAAAAAHRIARNDLETPVASGRGDGMHELSGALETMRESLLKERTRFAGALHQAESARATLDELVAERTRELAYSEQQYGLTFERAGVGIAHISVDGNWLQVNDRFCQILGYSAVDLRGTGFQRFSLPADLADERAALGALLDGRAESSSGEKRMVRKDGSLVWVSQTVSLLRDEAGMPQRYIFVVDDISKRKSAESALQRSEQRLSTILWATPAAIISVDSDGKVCSFNQVAEQVFGYASDEIIGRPVDILVPPKLRQVHRVYMAGYSDETNSPHNMNQSREITGYRRNGEIFPAAATVSKLELEDEDIFTVILVDVTRERAAEAAALAAKREAEIANRSKSTFLAHMSHELRTPLNAVIGYSQMLSQQMLGEIDNPKYLEYADIITKSGEHLLELISDILDVSKIEAGEFELTESEIAPESLIEECMAIVRERAESANLSLNREMSGPAPLVFADRLRMKQVILNLLSNAIKFTPPFGTITVSAETTARGLEIHIKDTGCGIAEQDIPRVLEPFGQAHNSMMFSQQGAGLGLPLVNSLMALHGGTLEIDSTIRNGTTATVIFPPERIVAGDAGQTTAKIPLSAGG
jgi:PAS domain S-box-containing protein